MGIFSKIFKGIKKVVKKIGKGIKKVVGKIGRAFGKFGIVGQLGLMFLMPYALTGLSSLWGTAARTAGVTASTVGATAGATATAAAATTAGTGFGGWAANMAAKKGLSGILGKTAQLIHSAGTLAAKPFSFVSDVIGSSVDFLVGKGTDLVNGVKNVFGIKTPTTGGIKVPLDSLATSTTTAAPSNIGGAMDLSVAKESIRGPMDLSGVEVPLDSLATPRTITASEFGGAMDVSGGLLAKDKAKEGWWDKLLSAPERAWEKLKSTDPADMISGSIKSGIEGGIATRVGYKVAGKPPTQGILHSYIPDLINAFATQNQTAFEQIDFALQEKGNMWMGQNLANYEASRNYMSDGSDDYNRALSTFESQAYNYGLRGGR